MGRFPYEVPVDLPDEQIALMLAYMEIRAEWERAAADGSNPAVLAKAREGEARLQRWEADAWKEASRRG